MTTRPTLEAALALIDDWTVPQGAPGTALAVWHDGSVVGERYVGDATSGVPVTAETMFPLASVTKPVVAAAALSLVERGDVSLDESVARIVPEFRAGPDASTPSVDLDLERLRQTVTVRQLLCHVSGLPEDVWSREHRYFSERGLDGIIDEMCRAPLQTAPGEELRYSNAGYGILTRVVETVSGESIWAITQRAVLDPLGMTDTTPHPTPDQDVRIAFLADSANAGTPHEAYNSTYWKNLGIPWAGLYGTPRDMVRFAGDCISSDPVILSRTGMAIMTSDQTLAVPGGVESAKVRWPIGSWGLGWEVKGVKRRHWTGDYTSPRTVCHFGQSGTLLWADPEVGVAVAVFSNRAVSHMWSFIHARWARLSNAVIASLA